MENNQRPSRSKMFREKIKEETRTGKSKYNYTSGLLKIQNVLSHKSIKSKEER